MTPLHLGMVLAFTGLAALQISALIYGARQVRRMLAALFVEQDPRPFLAVLAVAGVPEYLFVRIGHASPSAGWWESPLNGGWDIYQAILVIVVPFLDVLTVALLAFAGVGLICTAFAHALPFVVTRLPGYLSTSRVSAGRPQFVADSE
jgi:hypothetical protein